MPNHFHFLLKQEKEFGISTFISNFTNSITKYFNTKHERSGPLFGGSFKSELIETDEQLIHVSRYIHLNPVTSLIIREKDLDSYPWSSLGEYLKVRENKIVDTQTVMSHFSSLESYRQFVHDQINYAQEIEKIKHLTIEE
jgi:putative transposase